MSIISITFHSQKLAMKMIGELLFPPNSEKELAFDLEALGRIKKDAEDNIEEIKKMKQKVLDEVDKLRKDWNTPAGKVFFENLDDDWLNTVDKYVTTLNVFCQTIDEVIVCFTTVQSGFDALNFNV